MGRHGEWKGTPREQIPWYPSVDLSKCVGCRNCYDFCSHEVYGWDEAANTPTVSEPFLCVVGCNSCSHECDEGAIAFPPLTVLKGFLR
jgi:NAD-dependent dihydropyrimidine dehydrogenase PreA subunit